MCRLTEKEVKILEAAMRNVNFAEAAESLGMAASSFYTYLSRIRRKDKITKRFQARIKRYNKVLYKRFIEEQE
jgi:DNA-binding CsgD family transcriptional regulator